MDRDTYRRLIAQLWLTVAQLEGLDLLHLSIAAKRCGTADEYHAVRAMLRAYEDLPGANKSPKGCFPQGKGRGNLSVDNDSHP